MLATVEESLILEINDTKSQMESLRWLMLNLSKAGFMSIKNGKPASLQADFDIDRMFSEDSKESPPWHPEIDPEDPDVKRSKKKWAKDFVDNWLRYVPPKKD